jgi:hypothetical protein
VTAEAPHPHDALLPLVYGELSDAEARSVQRHVDGCPACAETVAGYRAVRSAAAALPREMEGASGLASLLHYGEQAAARARRRRGWRWLWPVAAGMAAIWVAVVAVRPAERSVPEVASPATPPSIGRQVADEGMRELAKRKAAGEERDAELAEAPRVARNEVGAAVGTVTGPRSQAGAAPKAPAKPGLPEAKTERREMAPSARQADDALARADVARARSSEAAADKALAAPPASAVAPLGVPSAPSAAQKRAAAPVPASAPQRTAAAESGQATSGGVAAPAELNAAASSSGTARGAASAADATAKTNVPVAGKASLVALDAGAAGQRSSDGVRRAALYVRLRDAGGAELLAVLGELCGVEVRLEHRTEALQACGRVVREYPGTPEAAAAQRQLDILNAR